VTIDGQGDAGEVEKQVAAAVAERGVLDRTGAAHGVR
jgi:hypothetical protein